MSKHSLLRSDQESVSCMEQVQITLCSSLGISFEITSWRKGRAPQMSGGSVKITPGRILNFRDLTNSRDVVILSRNRKKGEFSKESKGGIKNATLNVSLEHLGININIYKNS